MTGGRAVIDMLRAAGVVREHEGQLIATETKTSPDETTQQIETIIPRSVAPTTVASLHIELRIDAKPSELEGLGMKIQQLLRELNKPSQARQDDGANN